MEFPMWLRRPSDAWLHHAQRSGYHQRGKRTLEQGVDGSQVGAHVVLHPRVPQHVRHGRALRRVGLQHDAQQVRALGRHLQAHAASIAAVGHMCRYGHRALLRRPSCSTKDLCPNLPSAGIASGRTRES